MTTVEYGIGLEDKLFELDRGQAGHHNHPASGCNNACGVGCGGCKKKIDGDYLSSPQHIGSIRPTLPKTTVSTPSLLETYVATLGAENVTPKERTLLSKLEALDLDPIKVKLMDAEEGEGWTREQADASATAYKQYLFIGAKYGKNAIVPTKLVDKVWHYHILDTSKYAEDCQEIFGQFVHHFPYFGMRGEEDAANLKSSFAETQDLFVENFGVSQLASFDEKNDTKLSGSSVGHCKGSCGGYGICRGYCNSACKSNKLQ